MKSIKTVLLTALSTFLFLQAGAQDRVITFQELPAAAQKFISSHFVADDISYIKEERKRSVVQEYEVKFKNGDEVEFDKNSDWKEVSMKTGVVPVAIVPEKIRNYVTRSFPDTHIKEIKKKRRYIEVEISNGLELEFSHAGEFLRIDD